MEIVVQKIVEKDNKAQFNNAWFVTTIIGEKFHKNYRAWFKAHTLGYKGLGLGVTSQQQITIRKQRRKKCNLLDMSQPNYNLPFNKGLRWVMMAKGKERKIQGLW